MNDNIVSIDRISHQCCVCEKIDVWTDQWIWYGSIKEQEEGALVRKFCSSACVQRGKKMKVVPGVGKGG